MLPETEWGLLLPLAVAMIAGSLVGIERELRNKAAGVGTNMLICAGACLFTLLSVRVDGETTRIAANILTGVGFIGAGLILKESGTNQIKGLTTAAGIWMAAAVGMAFGFGYYVLGAAGTLIAIFAPRLPRWVYYKRAQRVVRSTIEVIEPSGEK